MSDQITHTAVAHSEAEKRALEQLHHMQSAFLESKELLGAGVLNETAALVLEAQNKPMQWLVRMLNEFSAELKALVATWVVGFFKKKEALLQSVSLVQSDSPALEYVLVPKQNSLETDYELNDFLAAYEQTDFHRHVPVIFHIVPAELAIDLQGVEPVNFA